MIGNGGILSWFLVRLTLGMSSWKKGRRWQICRWKWRGGRLCRSPVVRSGDRRGLPVVWLGFTVEREERGEM
ncbi:hypothetical protein TIFTF001_025898 [Ficus carica]|uniref:Uncharacterized protein n=1 Tax=Ficus carica TaxID=3494 RepID=A0AA88DEL9_FICCA|nr:hypothetical protein TIFTF001_025898 [Ficus carica]